MSTTTASKTERPGWDKRAWRLGAIFCGVIGATTLAGTVGPDIAHSEGSALGTLVAVSLLLAIIVFPPIMSGLARRRTLLWAYLPLAAWLAWVVLGALIVAIGGWDESSGSSSGFSDNLARDLLILVGVLLGGPLITAGPVCIIRYAIKLANLRNQARAVEMERAIYAPREGVWPPPPTDSGSKQ